MQPLFLKIFHKDKLLKVQPFTETQLSIGSGEGLSLKLSGLSAWHCLIENKKGQYYIFDLESQTGTFVNGKKIQGEVVLKSGDVIQMGDYRLEFLTQPPTASSKPVPQAPSKAPQVKKSPPKAPSPPSTKPSKKSSPPQEATPSPSEVFSPGSWHTFAPPSRVKNLDDYLEPSIGNLIEVVVAWKERILSVSHFSHQGNVYMGTSEDCDVIAPHALGHKKYKLLQIKSGARVFLSHGVKGALIQGKNKNTRTVTDLSGDQNLVLKPYEAIRVNFNNSIQVYVRIKSKPQKPLIASLFNLKSSEVAVLFFSFCLALAMIIYSTLYVPLFLLDDVKFAEEQIRVAQVKFDRTPRVVEDYKLGERTRVARRKGKLKKPKPKLIRQVKRKKSLPTKRSAPVKKKVAKQQKRRKLIGKIKTRSKAKPRVKVGSARPGGSLKTGKRGASPKTVAPDPTKVGLLGVFGGGGQLEKLDKGASGTSKGGLVGLAESATGYAGTEDSYGGKGIGTRTKEVASGGQGQALVGITGVKTKGRGDTLLQGKGKGGDLGRRGQVNIDVGADDFEVEGEIDRAAILRVIRINRNKFDRCYQFSLQTNKTLQGHLKMQWKILSNGRGSDAQVAMDRVGSSKLANCMARELENLRFPVPPSGQIPRISFKFVFSI